MIDDDIDFEDEDDHEQITQDVNIKISSFNEEDVMKVTEFLERVIKRYSDFQLNKTVSSDNEINDVDTETDKEKGFLSGESDEEEDIDLIDDDSKVI